MGSSAGQESEIGLVRGKKRCNACGRLQSPEFRHCSHCSLNMDSPLVPASIDDRDAAHRLDTWVMWGCFLLVEGIGILIPRSGRASVEAVHEWFLGSGPILILLFFLIGRPAYKIFFELMPRRATPGMMRKGLRIVSEDGGEPSVGQILTRNLSTLIFFRRSRWTEQNPFRRFLEEDSHRRGKHDRNTRTVVVYADSIPGRFPGPDSGESSGKGHRVRPKRRARSGRGK